MPPRMRLPSPVLRTSSICVPSSTPSPAGVRRTANGAHNPLTTRLKPRFTISCPLKNVSDRQNTTKVKTSTVSPLSPAKTFSQTDQSTLRCGPPYAETFVHPTLCIPWITQRRRTPRPAHSRNHPLSLQPRNSSFLFPHTLLHTYTRAEAGHSRRRPPGRNGYLLRWHHRHGRNNGTTY